MANIQALEHKGKMYVSLDDIGEYLSSLAAKAEHPLVRQALYAPLYKLREIQQGRLAA